VLPLFGGSEKKNIANDDSKESRAKLRNAVPENKLENCKKRRECKIYGKVRIIKMYLVFT